MNTVLAKNMMLPNKSVYEIFSALKGLKFIIETKLLG
jgi:hypothetical protein